MNDQNQYEKPPPYSPFPDHNSYVPTNAMPSNPQSVINVEPIPSANAYNPNTTTFLPNYGSISYGTIQVNQIPPQVVFIGSCPACRVGILEDDFTCIGVLLAILLFPIGILCCLALRQRRCPNCGTTYD